MICLSAGHHPTKPGACFGAFCEHDEAVRWVDIVCQIIGDDAIRVPPGVLKDKVEFINARLPLLAVEIHFNAAVDADGNSVGQGCETLYYPNSEIGKDYAGIIQRHLAPVFPPDRGIKEGWYRMDPKRGPDYFLRKTRCPAIIVEPEFIHHRDTISQHRLAGCQALAEALREIIGE